MIFSRIAMTLQTKSHSKRFKWQNNNCLSPHHRHTCICPLPFLGAGGAPVVYRAEIDPVGVSHQRRRPDEPGIDLLRDVDGANLLQISSPVDAHNGGVMVVGDGLSGHNLDGAITVNVAH